MVTLTVRGRRCAATVSERSPKTVAQIAHVAFQVVAGRLCYQILIMHKVGIPGERLLPTILGRYVEDIIV